MIHRTVPFTISAVVSAATLFAAALLSGCAGSGRAVPEKTAQQWYDQGTGLAGKKKHDEALEAFKEARKGYRGAELDVDIQLSLADTYFNKEEYPAAVEAYTEFLRMHPHNVRADYAQYRVALSWLRQLRSADRSQEPARKAAAAFEALLRGYPRSPLLAQGREDLLVARRRIAEHELGVADFYERTGKCQAAVGRYELVLRDYADLVSAERVLYQIGSCYRDLRDQEKAERFFEQLRREYPQGRFIKDLDNSRG